MWFDDLVGSIVAAVAMGIACATIVFAQAATRTTRYTLVFCIILILGYVVKVRHALRMQHSQECRPQAFEALRSSFAEAARQRNWPWH